MLISFPAEKKKATWCQKCCTAWKPQVYTIGPDCNLGSPFVLLCRAKQRAVLHSSAFVESFCSRSQAGVASGFPQSSCQISKFFPGCHSGKYSSVRRLEVKKALLGYAAIYTNTAWRMQKAGFAHAIPACFLREKERETSKSHFSYVMEMWARRKNNF